MAIAAYADRDRSPLAPDDDRYEVLLDRLTELVDHPGRFSDLWEEEDATLTESEQLIASRHVRIEEVADLDLAVVDVPERAPVAGGHRFGEMWAGGLHPMAIHNATDRFALLCVRGRSYELVYRYETWVQYRSRRPRPRVDLGPLAAQLTTEEPRDVRWVFEGAGALTPRLYLDGATESALSPESFTARLGSFMRAAPPAWDPYTP
jgi:hypothetical protein